MLIDLSREAVTGKYNKGLKRIIPDDAKPGIIVRIETAGGSLNFNPHFHCIETEGCYSPSAEEDRYCIVKLSIFRKRHYRKQE